MKFVCESCSARYRIDDERVQGKVLKIRCKKCSHIIEVRSQDATPSSVSKTEWHVSVNGVPRGPLAEETLLESFGSGAIGDEAYVWNASFDAWKAALEVPAFSGALQAAKKAGLRSQHPTTQRLDAGELDKAMAGQASNDVAARVSEKLQALRAEIESGSGPAAPEPAKLAAALESGTEATASTEDTAKTEEPALAEPAASPSGDEATVTPKPPARPSGPAASVASKSKALPAVEEPGVNADATPSTAGDDTIAASGADSVAAPTDTPDVPSEPATPGVPEEPATPVLPLAATPIGGQASLAMAATEEGNMRTALVTAESSGAVGAQPPVESTRSRVTTAQAAALPTAALQANQDPSASLLFQVRQAKSARNRAVAIAVVALLCMIGLMFAWSTRPEPELVVTNEPTVVAPIVRSEATPEALAALRQSRHVALVRASRIVHDALENGALAVTPVVPIEAVEAVEAVEAAVASNSGAGSTGRSSAPRIDHVQTSRNVGTTGNSRRRNVTRVASLDSLGPPAEVERASVGSPSLEVGSEGFYGAVGQTGSAVSPDLNAPELRDRRQGPSPELFADGLRSFVSSSVERCTQRQLMETGSIVQSRVVLSITVENSGEVSRVRADRGSRDTAFERCVQSHRGRWEFPSFNGGAQTLQRTYLLQ